MMQLIHEDEDTLSFYVYTYWLLASIIIDTDHIHNCNLLLHIILYFRLHMFQG